MTEVYKADGTGVLLLLL